MSTRTFRAFDRAALDATLGHVAAHWPDLAATVRAAVEVDDRTAALDAISGVRDELPLMTDATRRRGPAHVRALHALAMALLSDNARDAAAWVREAELG